MRLCAPEWWHLNNGSTSTSIPLTLTAGGIAASLCHSPHTLSVLSAEGAAEGAAAEEGAGDSHGSSGEEGASDEGGDEGAAAEVTAGEAADSLANLDQERALLKSVLAELEGAEDGDGAAEAPAQVMTWQCCTNLP